MSKFYFQCPRCKKEIKADTEWIGRSAECPYCNVPVTIPHQQAVPCKNEQKVESQSQKTNDFIFKCPKCKNELKGSKKFIGLKVCCPHCSECVEVKPDLVKTPPLQAVPPENKNTPVLVQCPCCKKEMSSAAPHCPHCGLPNANIPAYKSRATYIILGLLFGHLGIHNFYANQPMGVAHIAMTVCGIIATMNTVSKEISIIGVLALISNAVWVIAEVCSSETDGDGVPFK